MRTSLASSQLGTVMSQSAAPNPQGDADRLEVATDQAIAACVATARRYRLIRCDFKPVGVALWIWRGALRHDCSELTGRQGCSHSVLMESSDQNRRFPPPWRVEHADCY